MAYTKVNFTDGTTPLDATSMGKLDDALSDQDSRIDANTELIKNVTSIFNLGTEIQNETDLNTYTDPGKYYVQDSNESTIINAPYSGNGFSLWVIPTESLGRCAQILIAKKSSNFLYCRVNYTGSTWSSWYQINYTAV